MTVITIMLEKIIKYSPIIIFGILALLLQTGKVKFGNGLGDLIDHGFIYLGSILSLIVLIAKENVSPKIHQVLSKNINCIRYLFIFEFDDLERWRISLERKDFSSI